MFLYTYKTSMKPHQLCLRSFGHSALYTITHNHSVSGSKKVILFVHTRHNPQLPVSSIQYLSSDLNLIPQWYAVCFLSASFLFLLWRAGFVCIIIRIHSSSSITFYRGIFIIINSIMFMYRTSCPPYN